MNRIKEQQLGLFADRTSCQGFIANQFRLLLASAAYMLIEHLRGEDAAAARPAEAFPRLDVAIPTASPKWAYEPKKSGWTFAVRGERRDLLYLKPLDRHFTGCVTEAATGAYQSTRRQPGDTCHELLHRLAPRL